MIFLCYKNLTITGFKSFLNSVGIIIVHFITANIPGMNMAQSYPLRKVKAILVILKKLYTTCEQIRLSQTIRNVKF